MRPSPSDSVLELGKSLVRPVLIRGTVAATRLMRRLRGRPAAIPTDPTLAIVGFFETASGLGAAARGVHRALADHGPQIVSLSELASTPRISDAGGESITPRSPDACKADVAIHVYNPDVFLAAVRRCGTRFLTTARVNMALAIWETETLPPLWTDILSLYDVICTHSRFAARAFERATGRPVGVVAPCVPEKPVRLRDGPGGHYEFLCMFDHVSDIDRKNPLGAVEAFRDAWRRPPVGTTARLRIKCHAGTPAAVIEDLLAAAGDAPVEVVADTLDEAGMDALWQSCDCFLSLHRSEGFGMPVAEALSRGIPVIVTRQGGVVDFVDDEACFPVPGPAAGGRSTRGRYIERTGWIEPDTAVATRHILDVVTDYPAALKRASAGRDSIRNRLSPEEVRRQFDAALGACLQDRG